MKKAKSLLNFKAGNFAKKVVVILLLATFLPAFAGCGGKQAEAPKEQTKVVKIDSDPEGATVYIDSKEINGVTPVEHAFLPGTHKIYIVKETSDNKFILVYRGTIDITDDKKPQSVSVKLEKRMQYSCGTILFDDKPKFSTGCNPLRDFAGIYLNETVKISGTTYLNSFDLVFPSGKKVHFDTEKTGFKYEGGKDVRKFSKTVTFNEMGEYKILSDGKIVTPGAGGYREYKFNVLYKAEPVDTLTLGDLNGNSREKSVVLIPIGKTVYAKLLMKDVKGNIARNKPIGLNNLETDKNGIVTIKVENTQNGEVPFVIYNDIIGWDVYFTTFDKNGNLIESGFAKINQKGQLVNTVPDYIPKKTAVKVENGHIFMPFNCSGLSPNDLGFKHTVGKMIVHPKNSAIIYTNNFVSKDGGKTFHRFEDDLSFKTFAIDPNNTNIIYGSKNGILLKSTDYGAHFSKIANLGATDYIAIDPKDSNKIYVTTKDKLIVSKDNGKTWKAILNCSAIPWINPNNTDLILTTNCAINRSTDGGKTWDSINLYKKNPAEWNTPIKFAFDPENSNIVYAVTRYHLFKSEDSGKNWTLPTWRNFNFISNIAISKANPEKIYISDRNGILESDSGGKGFKNIGIGAPTPNAQFSDSVTVDSYGNVYALLCGIPFKYANGKWLPLNSIFIKGGPEWKIINKELYVDVKTIRTNTAVVQIDDNKITFYRLFDTIP